MFGYLRVEDKQETIQGYPGINKWHDANAAFEHGNEWAREGGSQDLIWL